MSKKKMTYQETYRKNTHANIGELRNYAEKSDEIYVHNQMIYDDGSMSFNVTIHVEKKYLKHQ